MKIRNIALCVLALSIIGGATAGAQEVFQTWKGKRVGVQVNGSELAGGGIQIDGKTYVPVRALSDTLQALVKVESDQVHIYKPNVNLMMFSSDKNGVKLLANGLYLGTYEFYVMAHVDHLETKVHSIKTVIVDPAGKAIDSQVIRVTDENQQMFSYTSSAFKINFQSVGHYKVKFYMKQTEDSEFELLSEKAILSMKKE